MKLILQDVTNFTSLGDNVVNMRQWWKSREHFQCLVLGLAHTVFVSPSRDKTVRDFCSILELLHRKSTTLCKCQLLMAPHLASSQIWNSKWSTHCPLVHEHGWIISGRRSHLAAPQLLQFCMPVHHHYAITCHQSYSAQSARLNICLLHKIMMPLKHYFGSCKYWRLESRECRCPATKRLPILDYRT